MLTLPLAVDASPPTAFVAAGLALAATAAATGITANRLPADAQVTATTRSADSVDSSAAEGAPAPFSIRRG